MTFPLAPAYREAVKIALAIQVVITLFLMTILDGGQFAKLAGCVMLGFWIGVAIVMVRRPLTPRPLDLFYIRWGYAVMLLPFVALAKIGS